VDIPEASQRVVAYVALHGGAVDRRVVAVRLWPDSPESRAAGNLRTALWRLRSTDQALLTTDRHRLRLSADTAVDVKAVLHWTTRVIDGPANEHDLDLRHLDACDGELLPGWYEDWVIFERERLRQRVLHALEVLTERLIAADRGPDAMEASLCAVRLDPLRESARRALIQAHLATGNLVGARHALDDYTQLLRDELDVAPPVALTHLVVSACRRLQH
jgi:DNA-binding SARP family transcriptional activator